MRIAITGATGLIGSAFAARLRAAGDDVVSIARGGGWDPAAGRLDAALLEGTDAVAYLGGENVYGRWTEAKKRRIRESRVMGTRLVSEAVAGLRRRPSVFLAASAVGFYGDRGDEELTESSAPGTDFLAQVARDWEAATAAAAAAGVRVVNLRFGIVLTRAGGALAKMLPVFRLGLGGPLGDGRQYFSWVALDDAVEALLYLLRTPSLAGPVNVTAPHPVRNREFVTLLGRALGRPAVVPVPHMALRLAFGADAAAMMLSGQRVLPRRLLDAGFRFRFPDVAAALRHILSVAA